MISCLVIVRNEERDLPECLARLQWSDDVVVFDSFSSDRSVEIARQMGARVVQRRFDGYASQRNAALHGVAFRNGWVLSLDADERLPEAAALEWLEFVVQGGSSVGESGLRFCGNDAERFGWEALPFSH